MAECDYYKYETKSIPREYMTDGRLPTGSAENKTQWCEHPKHAHINREDAILLSERRLKCKGMLDKCHLTDREFEDV